MNNPLQTWVGEKCTLAERRDCTWFFGFGAAATPSVHCLWRILAAGTIALCRDDDGQQFGLPSPVDAEARARQLLVGRRISELELAEVTSDLLIKFDGGNILQVINDSSGYEGWQATSRIGNVCREVIAQGGGNVAQLEARTR